MSPVLTGTLVHPDWMLMVPDTRHIQSGGTGGREHDTWRPGDTLQCVCGRHLERRHVSCLSLGRIKKQDEVV